MNKSPTCMNMVMRQKIVPADHGVVLVLIRDQSMLTPVRLTVEQALLQGERIADLPMPEITALKALYSAKSRDADFAESVLTSKSIDRQVSNRFSCLRIDHCRNFNGLTNEGVHLLLDHLDQGGCVTSQQALAGMSREDMIGALSNLDSGAKAREGLIVLFLQSTQSQDAAWAHQHTQEVILADKAEPGPGKSAAFSLTATSLENQHAWGIGQTMHEVWEEDGGWKHDQNIFVAATALDRAIWYLCRDGETITTIASLLGKDKSNISRRLKALPLPKNLDADVNPYGGWREDWLPFLGVDFDTERDGEDEHGRNPDQPKTEPPSRKNRREL